MEAQIKKILEEVLETDIDFNTSTENCDAWDSMNQVNIILEIQEVFNIKIPMDKAMSLNSYQAIQEYLQTAK